MAPPAHAAHDREALLLFANQIALSVERVQLRDQAIQTRLAERVDRLAKMLVTAVSHDLRAPLASIKASSSILSDESLDIDTGQAHELAHLIDFQADRLAELVRNLLDMGRIQAGVLRPHCTAVDLHELVGSVVAELAPVLDKHTVEVDVPGEFPTVMIDPMLIERVLVNLLTNAARHAPKSTAISIVARRTATDDVEVSVADSGPGVSPERRADIFGLNARREQDAGAGLGLIIARTFVEAHGQRIWVDDTPAAGARFCFALSASPVTERGGAVVTDSRH